ncbi:MAG: DUF4296 domain-containing protein [Flavobacteriales bacterium]|nr:DUF4296 domain-containing protein [Flavobacteriales bacterium]
MKTSTFPLHESPSRSHFPSLVPRPSSLFPHILFSIFLLSSCNSSENSNQLPIPQEQMVSIMVDMHLAESAANLKLTEADSTRPSYQQLIEAIFEKHGTTRATFDSTLYKLSFQPTEMNAVYDLVLERLSEMDAGAKARSGQSSDGSEIVKDSVKH